MTAMQLSEIQCLTADWSEADLSEMTAIMHSVSLTTPSSRVRLGAVDPAELQCWIREGCADGLKSQFETKRISTLSTEDDLPPDPRTEHLVIRDLDMDRLDTAITGLTPGRVIAQADWYFTSSYRTTAELWSGVNTTDSSASFPVGFNKELHLHLCNQVESTLRHAFGGLPLFELRGISTLTPSHLRKGIAKRLVQWVFPYADRFSLPVVLAANPLGLFLYRACSFEEYRQFDITLDLADWGGQGIHQHVIMVRWPDDMSKLPTAWQQWRATNQIHP